MQHRPAMCGIRTVSYLIVAFSLLFPPLATANPIQAQHVEVELVADTTSVRPGQPFWAALRLDHEDHWHTYWRNPGDSGLPTRIEWQLPAGTTTSDIAWQYPDRIDFTPLVNYGYEGEVLLPVQITPPADWQADEWTMTASASWLICKEICIPGDATLSLTLPISTDPPTPSQWHPLFLTTLERVPTPTSWEAAIGAQDGNILLRMTPDDTQLFDGASAIQFFPVDAEVIENAAAQTVVWEAPHLYLSQQQSDYFSGSAANFNGILIIDQTRAYAFTAAFSPVAWTMPTGINLNQVTTATPTPAAHTPTTSLPQILLFALLGGLILNLMPCVFPVLSLKALSLVKTADMPVTEQRLHGVVYTLGVLVSFGIIAGLLIGLQAGGASIGWGFQLQSPWFIALLSYLLFAMALSLSGVVEFGTQMMGLGNSLTTRQGYQGSFFTGVLATIVASPCTAPFMGTAIGFAVTQPPWVSLSVFLTLGFGMALPFLLLALIPGLARFMPKPGAWMETFKQLMAFPLYATVVWLLWVLGRQTDANTMASVLGGMVLLAFALWMWQHSQRFSSVWKAINVVLVIGAFGLALLIITPLFSHSLPTSQAQAASHETAADWEPFSVTRLNELRSAGKPVFVNMTADWCITCLVNERVALSSQQVKQAFAENDITYLKGDWTNHNSEITAVLADFGRNGVPLYLYYPADAEAAPTVLPQILTPALVTQALEAS